MQLLSVPNLEKKSSVAVQIPEKVVRGLYEKWKPVWAALCDQHLSADLSLQGTLTKEEANHPSVQIDLSRQFHFSVGRAISVLGILYGVLWLRKLGRRR